MGASSDCLPLQQHSDDIPSLRFPRTHSSSQEPCLDFAEFASTAASEQSYIIAGDTLGGVSIYPWDLPHRATPDKPLPSSRRLDVFQDAPVKVLAGTPLVFAAGSSHGSVRVIDVLTLEILRTFTFAPDVPVRNIVLRRELLIASAGVSVMAWKAGPVGKDGKQSKGKKKAKVKEMHQDRKWQSKLLDVVSCSVVLILLDRTHSVEA